MFVNTKDLFLKPQVMKFMDLVQFQTTQVIFKASHNMLHGNVQHFFKTWEKVWPERKMQFEAATCLQHSYKQFVEELHKDIKQSGNIAQYNIFDLYIGVMGICILWAYSCAFV